VKFAAKLTSRPRIHYAWVIAGVTFLTLLATAGVGSTRAVLIVPLEQEFGWTRATISAAVAINLLLFGLGGPFAASLMERFGVRRVMLSGLLLLAVGVGLTPLMREPWQLIALWGFVIGSATGGTAIVLGATVANRWFANRRGLVVGIFTAANATGQLIFLPLLASLIGAFGWRAAALTTLGVALVVTVLVAVFMRDQPVDVGQTAYGVSEAPGPEVAQAPASSAIGGLLLGLRSGDFWLLSMSFLICGLTTNGLIGTHLIPASMDHGMPEVAAASLVAAMGVFDLVGTTASGWLSDRVDNRILLAWYYGLRGLSLMFLPYAFGGGTLSLAGFVVFYGLDWVATVPPTVRLTADIFGRRNVGIIFGWIFAAHQLGAAMAAFGAGVLRTWLGDYQVAFMTAGLLCLLACGLVMRIGRSQRTVAAPRVAAAVA
jgi:MFS family permease